MRTIALRAESWFVERVTEMRFTRREFAGALGDLGTFLPLTLGVSAVSGLDFGRTLIFAGACNIVTGFLFRIPMCVQPMKAIATLAIAQGLSGTEVVAAGLISAAVILVLSLSSLVSRFANIIPGPISAGIQLGLAAQICSGALKMVWGGGDFLGWGGFGLTLLCFLVLLRLGNSEKVPAALVVFAIGLAVAVTVSSENVLAPRVTKELTLGFNAKAVQAAGTQIPLTVVNSIIAVCALSGRLFPNRPAQPLRVGVSVAAMNFAGYLLGAQPMCHGAGGLAGQYRFGARTAGSMVMLGGAKILCGVLFAGVAFNVLSRFPGGVLGVMLLVSAFELAKPAVKQREVTAVVTAIMMLALGAFAGCLAGIAVGTVVPRPRAVHKRPAEARQDAGGSS